MNRMTLSLGMFCALCGLVWMVVDCFSGVPWQGVGIAIAGFGVALAIAGFIDWSGEFFKIAASAAVLCGFAHMLFETDGTNVQRQMREQYVEQVFLKLDASPNDYGLTQSERLIAAQGWKVCAMQPGGEQIRSVQAGAEAIYVPMEVGFFARLWQSITRPFSGDSGEKRRTDCFGLFDQLHATKPALMENMERVESERGRGTFP